MQTEINGTFHSVKNCSLNFRKLTNGTAFSEIYEFKGCFPFDQTKIPVWISGNFHGRMVQALPVWKTTSRTVLFAWNFSIIYRFKSQNKTLIRRHSEMARIFKSTTRIPSTSMVFSLTTNTLAQILISPVHSNVKTISCVQKLVIRILCASLAYKDRVIRIHSSKKSSRGSSHKQSQNIASVWH